MRPAADIVLPGYNPGVKWAEELISFHNFACGQFDLNFIVVNDGSTGNTVNEGLKLLERNGIQFQYIHYHNNRGKGYALREGVRRSKNNWTLYTDIDFPFTNQSTLNVLKTLTAGTNDVVAGFRNEEYYLKKMSGFRVFLSKSFRAFIKRFLHLRITDTQCGLKGFNAKGREKFLQTTTDRYLFDFEFIYATSKSSGIKMEAVEVELKDNVQFSKMRPAVLFRELINLIRILIFKKV